MPAALTGPRLPPRSGTAKQLVVFLHGYGADGNDLIEIGRQWQRWLPDAAFVAERARAHPRPADGPAMVRPHLQRSARALAPREPRRPRARRLARPGACEPQPAGLEARPRRLQPGHHDGAAPCAAAA